MRRGGLIFMVLLALCISGSALPVSAARSHASTRVLPRVRALPAGRPTTPSRLHATRGTDPAMYDARGAQVLLRGVNVNGLGEYYQANPDFPTVIPLRRGDVTRIARLGFNTIRLIVHWSRLEPERGTFDRSYVRRIARVVRWARKSGLYVVLDMHQDAWGPFIDTPPEEVCPPGTNRSVGWDGAPEWATLTNGLSTCNLGLRELSPAVGQAWENFYADTDGIQTELVTTWAKLARRFAADPTVAGYDLLNEPNPGPAAGANDTAQLGAYYGRVIAAIRAAEATVPGGFSHIAFFEPGVTWSAAGTYPTPDPTFTDDENLVFAPHIYAESIAQNSIENGFAWAKQSAALYGVTVWAGEWGYFSPDPASDTDKLDRYGAAEDSFAFGGAWWDWKQACGDPHVIHTPGGQPDPVSPSLVRYVCPANKAAGPIAPAYGLMMSRPTVRSAPGRITSLSSDGRTGAFTLEGARADGVRGCALRVFLPSRLHGATVSTEGISRVRIRRVLGDYRLRGCTAANYRLTITPRG